MTQRAYVCLGSVDVAIELPSADEFVVPGVRWGLVEAFPTPAYWAYQTLARRLVGDMIRNRLGSTLTEEVAACLLGGHGIPASVGIAAFEQLKRAELFRDGVDASEAKIFAQLSRPIDVGTKTIRYRFAKQKSKYLAAAIAHLRANSNAIPSTGRALRDWLLVIPGIGHKTASWISRNWLNTDDVAILDIHVLRAGVIAGVFNPNLQLPRDYVALETKFIEFSRGLNVRAAELDAVIWREMSLSRSAIHPLIEQRAIPSFSTPRTKKRNPNADQAAMRV